MIKDNYRAILNLQLYIQYISIFYYNVYINKFNFSKLMRIDDYTD